MAALPHSMQAVRIDRFGGPEVVGFADLALPEPRHDEILLKVHAASLNPVDWKIREGKYPAVQADKLPYVLGRDLSGTVAKRGSGVTAFADGDDVYGMLDIARGSFAQYVVVRTNEVTPIPHGLTLTTAASVPLAGLTAWQGLFRHGRLQPGQRVLIHAGSGGVGHFAVQFAKARGAYVISTASSENLHFVRSLGADEVLDYKKEAFEDATSDIDLVFDLVGGETQERSWSVLKRGGALVSTLTAPSSEQAKAHGAHGTRYTAEASMPDLREITALIEAGKVRPFVSKTFAFHEVKAGLAALEKGSTVGKTLLTMEPGAR